MNSKGGLAFSSCGLFPFISDPASEGVEGGGGGDGGSLSRFGLSSSLRVTSSSYSGSCCSLPFPFLSDGGSSRFGYGSSYSNLGLYSAGELGGEANLNSKRFSGDCGSRLTDGPATGSGVFILGGGLGARGGAGALGGGGVSSVTGGSVGTCGICIRGNSPVRPLGVPLEAVGLPE